MKPKRNLKKKLKTSKRKKKTLVLTAPTKFEFGKFNFHALGDELFLQNQKFGKKLKKDGIRSNTVKSVLRWVFFNKKTEQMSMHIHMDLDKLDNFVKECKKDRTKWRRWSATRKKKGMPQITFFIKHLNPELHFLFDYKC